MSKLNEGVKLKEVYWAEGRFTVGDCVESITVSMEVGQMAMIPWALVRFTSGKVQLVNLAHCEGVVLEKDEEESCKD